MVLSNTHKIRLDNLSEISPLTENQKLAFQFYEKNHSLVLAGSAGTGKTFMALGLALEDVLDKETQYDKVVVVRSIVPTRDIGFLPGNEEEKKDAYTGPYRSVCTELFNDPQAWTKLNQAGQVEFLSTSFIRGITLSDAIIVVDEMQNLTFHELDSIITRVGRNCKFVMCGDYYQSDFTKDADRKGILKFLNIIEQLNNFKVVEFGWEDIVRSDFVRDYIMTKEMLERNGKV
jgi:predicted ribonuclease YlaK|tara:strand:+ start:15378 stop:16073 length:696 start_codon:yes stop_codon:yes gene_type:complete